MVFAIFALFAPKVTAKVHLYCAFAVKTGLSRPKSQQKSTHTVIFL